MSRNLISRRAGVPAVVTAAAIVAMGSPALADVTVNPPTAVQGSGQNVHLLVKNTSTSPITEVKLVIPADNPIAEVFPLSVDDWAPRIDHRKLDTPLKSIHNGSPVTETAASVTWIKVNGPLAPGQTADLAVALGPLPTTSTLSLSVVPTYAGGKSGPAMPPAVMTLTPAAPGQATGHTGHGGGTTGSTGDSASDDALFAAVTADANDGPGFWTIAGWMVAGLALAGAAVMFLRGRRPVLAEDETDEEDEPEEKKEPVAAGARVTSWSYRDDPE